MRSRDLGQETQTQLPGRRFNRKAMHLSVGLHVNGLGDDGQAQFARAC